MSESTRQLAAIMFTDIVVYTAMMGEDSNKILELVRQSKQIQKPLVEQHYGKWLKEMGDGVMAQFGSALDAVNCALEIQRTSRADFKEDLRIILHLLSTSYATYSLIASVMIKHYLSYYACCDHSILHRCVYRHCKLYRQLYFLDGYKY